MRRTACLLLLLGASLAAAQTTDGRASGLKAADLRKIRATKLRFVLPTFVPRGYKVTLVELGRDRNPMLASLAITYRKGSSEIFLNQASEGLGSIDFQNEGDKGSEGTAPFTSAPLTGRPVLMVQKEKGRPQWRMDWVKMRHKGYPSDFLAIGTNSSPQEGVALLKSLRYLR